MNHPAYNPLEDRTYRRAVRLWLHATPIGRLVYKSYGFTPVNQHLSPEATIEMEIKLQSKEPVRLPPG